VAKWQYEKEAKDSEEWDRREKEKLERWRWEEEQYRSEKELERRIERLEQNLERLEQIHHESDDHHQSDDHGRVVTCEVLEVKDAGIEVKIIGTDLTTSIKRSELGHDYDGNDQRPECFEVGEKVDARVIQFDNFARKVQVSIKALLIAEEKEAIALYGYRERPALRGNGP
jgi:ribosomal protein S1